jgi:5'-nucleotidase
VGASFDSLAANTFTAELGGDTLLAPYVIRELGAQRIAFVGLTLEGTRRIAAGAAGLTFGDEADTVNALVPELQAMGIETIVALVHEGGGQSGGPSSCTRMGGAIVDIVSRFDPAIDVVITGHTHQAYVCELDGHLVTSAGSSGRLVTAVDLVFDDTGALLDASATNVEVPLDLAPEPVVGEVVDRWVEDTRTIRERVVGQITASLSRGGGVACNFVADAMLESARATDPSTQLALMNAGGIRADILFTGTGDVTFGDLYTALPFGNRLVLVTLTGADLIAALDEAARTVGATPLCPSATLTYAWRVAGGTASGTVLVDGAPVDPAASYRVVVNDYNFAGGEGYTVFQERGTSVSATPLLLVGAAERFLEARSPYTPDTMARVTLAP